jgi:protein-S-isoprenylcysteine O-methyltransferase Ste14
VVEQSTYSIVLAGMWLAWLACWLVCGFQTKTTVRRESIGSRMSHVLPMLAVAVLMVSRRLPINWLYGRFLPATTAVALSGMVLTAAGLAFAIWARLHLGGNWSGTITLKQGHTLVRTGPYRLVRHPIYSGLLLALLGSAIAIGEWRGLLAVALVGLALPRKASLEERWLRENFGNDYERYASEVPALIPSIMRWGSRERGNHEQ